jgi:hypothetical protein
MGGIMGNMRLSICNNLCVLAIHVVVSLCVITSSWAQTSNIGVECWSNVGTAFDTPPAQLEEIATTLDLAGRSVSDLIGNYPVMLEDTRFYPLCITEAIELELQRRQPFSELHDAVLAGGALDFRAWLIEQLENMGDPGLDEFLRPLAMADTSELAYYALLHFARRGDIWALERLRVYFEGYPVSSVEWAQAVRLFGEYSYRPAACDLATHLDWGCLNVTVAVMESLAAIFPEDAEKFMNIDETRLWADAYVAEHCEGKE